MKTMLHVLAYEWKSLWRGATLKTLLAVVLGAGIYGIYFGKHEIDKQQTRIDKVERYERQQFDSLLAWARLDTALAGNKEKYQQALSPTGVGWAKHFTYYVSHHAPPLAGLCIGQRDLFPAYYGFNVTDLARQTNVGELANPMKLLTGNFDLSYVVVFLLPLLIVALFYNLYAAEKEGGTLALLLAQPVPLGVVLLGKGIVRFLVVLAVATLLLLAGFALQGISLAAHFGYFAQWLLAMYGYCCLWAVLMAGIVALRRSSALSAMAGLAVWLALAIVGPALANLLVQANLPLPNRAAAIHAVRKLNDKNWESPKKFVFDRFYEDHPQYNLSDTANFNKWYYASFTLLDKENHRMAGLFEAQSAQRAAALKRYQWLMPAAAMHERLANITKTGRHHHMAFVAQVRQYHANLKKRYYTRIFNDQQFTPADLQALRDAL